MISDLRAQIARTVGIVVTVVTLGLVKVDTTGTAAAAENQEEAALVQVAEPPGQGGGAENGANAAGAGRVDSGAAKRPTA